MADLTYLQSALEVKLVGQSLTGVSTNAVNADAEGNLLVKDAIATAGQYRAQSVTTSAAEALGAATILVNRKMLSITPTNGVVYWGFNSSVTTTTGTPIQSGVSAIFSFTDNVHVFLIAASTVDCRIAEGS